MPSFDRALLSDARILAAYVIFMLIGSLSGISYLDFLAHLGPVALGRSARELGGAARDVPAGFHGSR